MIAEAIEILLDKKDLSQEQMRLAMGEIMAGQAAVDQIVSFLTALNDKGQTEDELIAAAMVMRSHAIRINTRHKVILDTCGTGGDQSGTFNISTIVAFVAAGSGIAVAKHGNRSVSSPCGSADILEALGVNINLDKKKIEYCLDEAGVAFLFAQSLHPAMKYAMPARKQIARRTIFNILGPLSNPAFPGYQLLGVFALDLTETLARVLARLGSQHVLVACGKDGLDEITTVDKTFICQAKAGEIKSYEISPEDFGFKRAKISDLKGGSASDNAKILLSVLKKEPGPRRDIVVLNSAFAIYTADKVSSVKEGIELAKQSIDSGRALEKLELLKKYSHL
jgi:anthranilate phosphoribosyltransferase